MKDLVVNRSIVPDWGNCKAIALAYPYKMKEREQLIPFYDKLLSYIPEDIDIVLLARNISFANDYKQKCLKNGVNNKIEFIEMPQLSDIWVRDYAPLTLIEMGMLAPVKFEYKPTYVEKKYEKYIQYDNEAGHLLGEKCIGKGERALYFKWDMGNLTHNGKGTAIITNRIISDNETVSIDHELKPVLHVWLGFSNIIFIPVEPEDKTGHVDGMVRFIDEKIIVVGAYPTHSSNHRFMEILAKELKSDLGEDYTIIRLVNAEPENYVSEGICSAVGNHVNFLRINELILFPYYSDEISKQPLMDFKSELEKNNLPLQIIPIDIPEINELARKGGVLNCISWQIFSRSDESDHFKRMSDNNKHT
jgi:agmatine deiminase